MSRLLSRCWNHLLVVGLGAALAFLGTALFAPGCGGTKRPARPDLPPPVYERAPSPGAPESPGETIDLDDDEEFEEDPDFDSPPVEEPEPAETEPEPEPAAAPTAPPPVKDPLRPVPRPDTPMPRRAPIEPLPIIPPEADPLPTD